jgi:hypothetical protein
MGTSSVRCTDFEPCSTSVIERGPLRAYSVGCAAFTPVFCLMAFLARVCSAADADGELSLSTRQAPMSGTSQPIWYLYSLNPDCSLAGMPSMEVLTAPSHGSIEVRNVESFPAHPATDPRHECNQRKSAMTGALYTPDTGFIGSDKFVIYNYHRSASEQSYASVAEHIDCSKRHAADFCRPLPAATHRSCDSIENRAALLPSGVSARARAGSMHRQRNRRGRTPHTCN